MADSLYACIKMPLKSGKWLMKNNKVRIGQACRLKEFEIKILSASEKGYIQLVIYVYSLETTQLLGDIDSGLGNRIGMKLHSLYWYHDAFTNRDFALYFSQAPVNETEVFDYAGLSDVRPYDGYEETVRFLTKQSRIDSFWEMMEHCEQLSSDKQPEKQTLVYGESYFSRKNPVKSGFVRFENNLSLQPLKCFAGSNKKTAVLNFANPVEPGGGILCGANAQEEYLCRNTDLYKSLISSCANAYYVRNTRIKKENQYSSMFIGTGAVIWSQNVMILKKTNGYSPLNMCQTQEVYESQYTHTNVLTCAAPFFSGSGFIIPNGDLKYILMKRIKTIFEVAIQHGVDVLVLGAFGCGAFHNPPEVVADAFRECLLQPRYRYAFDEVIFAVKREAVPSHNVEEFERYFSGFPFFEENGCEKRLHQTIKNCRMEENR